MTIRLLAMLFLMVMTVTCLSSCGGDDDDESGGSSLAGTSWVYSSNSYTETFSFYSSSTGRRSIRFTNGETNGIDFTYTRSGDSGRMIVDSNQYYEFKVYGEQMRITYHFFQKGEWESLSTYTYTKQ